MSELAGAVLSGSYAMSTLTTIDRARETEAGDPLVEALVRGEAEALEQLYREHHRAVRALGRRFVREPAQLEDLVHDVFVQAPRAFRSYRGEGSVRSFLFTLTVRTAQHTQRAAARRRGWLERLRGDGSLERPAPATPLDDVLRRGLAESLHHALERLSFDHRAVVILCELEELSHADVARVLQVPEPTVRSRLFHAKAKLRRMLGGPR